MFSSSALTPDDRPLFAVQVAAVNVFDSLANGHTARAALRVDPWVR
jgi:hypothetical protein